MKGNIEGRLAKLEASTPALKVLWIEQKRYEPGQDFERRYEREKQQGEAWEAASRGGTLVIFKISHGERPRHETKP